jgi:photosystem II stability/assembly factor-like uncharacterized protein
MEVAMQSSVRLSQVFSSLLLILLSLAAPAAAAPHWAQATPFGGQLVALAQAPSSPQTLYTATIAGRVFRSLDGGATWGERQSGLPDALIVDFLVDSQDSRTVFARTSTTGPAAILRTRNGGQSWTAVWTGFGGVYGMALDGLNPGVVYAGSNDGLYRSTDGGDTWTASAFSGFLVYTVTIDPHDPNTFLAAVYSYRTGEGTTFWRSVDHGATWTVSATGIPPGPSSMVQRIVFDPVRAGTAYAVLGPQGDQGSAFRTTDGGVSWTLLTTAIGLRDLAPSPDGTLFGAADFGIARSNDLGETWTPALPAALTPETAPRDVLSRLIVSEASPDTLFAAGSEGVWKSTDSGGSWIAANQGVNALPVVSLAVAPTGPANVLAVAGDSVFRSADRGVTWRNVHTVFDGPQPYVIDAFDPHNPQTVYGVTFDGQADYLVKSTNGGSDWSEPATGFGCGGDSICDVAIPAVVLDPQRPGNLFMGVESFIHFQGFSEHLVYSPDGGATWKARSPLHNLQALAIDPEHGNVLYGLTCKTVYKSENGAVSWRRLGSGLPGSSSLCAPNVSGRQRLAVDPSQPQTLYVGTVDKGVYRSTDGGATFRPFNRGLDAADVTTVLVGSTGSVYAAVPKKGVWRWDASLRRWAPQNSGLPVGDFAGVLALDPRHPSTLYAGTQSHGVYRLDP